MTEAVEAKQATLDAGRKKLEEFRRKKEASQNRQLQQAKLDEVRKRAHPIRPTDALTDSRTARVRFPRQAKPILEQKSRERESALEQQCAELLASVDGLHRSLNDERFNSSQLEATIAELRRELSEKVGSDGAEARLGAEIEALRRENDELVEASSKLEALADEAIGLKEEAEAAARQRADELAQAVGRIAELEEMAAGVKSQDDLEATIQETIQAAEKLELENAELKAALVAAQEAAATAATSETAATAAIQAAEKLELENAELKAALVAAQEAAATAATSETAATAAIQAAEKLELENAELKAALVAAQEAVATAAAGTKDAVDASTAEELAGVKSQNATLQSRLQAMQAELQSTGQREQQQAAELDRVKDSLASEKRRATQLEQLVASSSAGNKKLDDDDEDMEAAALAGGSAFKPLVGVIRSLPPALGNNSLINELAKKLDKASVALDARPAIRAGVIAYVALLHLILLI